MNPLLITGHKGMLGRELFAIAEHLKWNPVGFDLPEHDLTNRTRVSNFFLDHEPRLKEGLN